MKIFVKNSNSNLQLTKNKIFKFVLAKKQYYQLMKKVSLLNAIADQGCEKEDEKEKSNDNNDDDHEGVVLLNDRLLD